MILSSYPKQKKKKTFTIKQIPHNTHKKFFCQKAITNLRAQEDIFNNSNKDVDD